MSFYRAIGQLNINTYIKISFAGPCSQTNAKKAFNWLAFMTTVFAFTVQVKWGRGHSYLSSIDTFSYILY